MMYLYRLAYGTYDIYGSTELTHTRKIGKREFNNMIVESILELLLNRRDELPLIEDEQEGEIPNFRIQDALRILENKEECENTESIKQHALKDADSFIKNWCNPLFTTGGDIVDKIIPIMIKKYGFKYAIYEHYVCFDYFGDIVDPGRVSANERENSDISHVIEDRVRNKYWKRLKKTRVEDVKKINERKIKEVRNTIAGIKQAQAVAKEFSKIYKDEKRVAKDVIKFNKKR